MSVSLTLLAALPANATPDYGLSWSGEPLPRITLLLADPDSVGGGQELGFATVVVPDADGDGQAEVVLGAFGDAVAADDDGGSLRSFRGDALARHAGETLLDTEVPVLLGTTGVRPLGSALAALADPTAWPRAAWVVGARAAGSGDRGEVFLTGPTATPWEHRDQAPDWLELNAATVTTTASQRFGSALSACPLGDTAGGLLVVGAPRTNEATCDGEVLDNDQGIVRLLPGAFDQVGPGDIADGCVWSEGVSLLGQAATETGVVDDRFGATTSCGGAGEPSGGWLMAGNNVQCTFDGCDAYAVLVPADLSGVDSGVALDVAPAVWRTDRGRLSHGWVIAGPGTDLDGDGADDVVIGLPGFEDPTVCPGSGGDTVTGAVAIYYADPDAPFTGEMDLGPDGADLFLCGSVGGRWLGRALTGGQDFNGDGIDDLFVSDTRVDADADPTEEEVWALYGATTRRTGVQEMADVAAWSVQVVDLAGSEGPLQEQRFGYSLSLGHVDGDELADLVVGAHYLGGLDGTSRRGGAWVLFGAADLDADGFLPPTLGGTDCADTDPTAWPGAPDPLGDGLDQDCDGLDGSSGGCVSAGDCDGDGAASTADCDDRDAWTGPGLPEQRDLRDNDCDGQIDEGTRAADSDGDGWSIDEGDCDDSDADSHPLGDEGATADGRNQDCDLRTDEQTIGYDDDGDGVVDPEDCDDLDPTIRPGATDSCDGMDQDCDSAIDEDAIVEGWLDRDGDGYGDPGAPFFGCPAPANLVENALDCDDGSRSVHPGAPDACDGVDSDCDGELDEDGWVDGWVDSDGDGYGDPERPVEGCPGDEAVVDQAGDCDDSRSDVHPGWSPPASAEDRDCSGAPDQSKLVGCAAIGGAVPSALLIAIGAIPLLARRRRSSA